MNHRSLIRCARALAFAGAAATLLAIPATAQNPFLPPSAHKQFAPDRAFNLKNVLIDLKVDYKNKMFTGTVENTMVPFKDGTTVITLHCGPNLKINSCTVNGASATFKRDGQILSITSPTALPAGKPVSVVTRYAAGDKTFHNGIMADSGFHWIKPNGGSKLRVGFWTQGESELNREWVPTWDYPNNLATSETRVTVPADWTVIGNGTLMANTLSADKKSRTFDWKMTLPHATYLISLVGGPFDTKTVQWRGIPVMYVVPKGRAGLIDSSFSDTPDMLSYFSDLLGVKYAWPKYAENAMFDFGGGMENVSATTLPDGALTDPREGFRNMASLNAHELAHQWFGDLVTCRDWGNLWLNEGFATYFEAMYMEHSRGNVGYAYEINGDMNGYIGESKRYKRPTATNMYPYPDAMFDGHTYPKGASILHTIRRLLGDKLFFGGIGHYLKTYGHTNVVSADLCRALTDYSGYNLEPVFQQWVWAPGHPVLDPTWTYDDAAHSVKLTVKQTQDTKDGTPVYSWPAKVGLIANGKLVRVPVNLSKTEETFSIPSAERPDAVLLDPDHDFLREVPDLHWSTEQLPAIVQYAPSPIDRSEAFGRMLSGTPSAEAFEIAVKVLKADRGQFPVFRDTHALAAFKHEDLRAFWVEELGHPDFGRRNAAVEALAQLQKTPEETARLQKLVTDQQALAVVVSAINTLNSWDAAAAKPYVLKAATIASPRETVRQAAFAILTAQKAPEAVDLIVKAAAPGGTETIRTIAIDALGRIDPSDAKSKEALLKGLKDDWTTIVLRSAAALVARKDPSGLEALKALKKSPPADAPEGFAAALDVQIAATEKLAK